MELYLDLLLFNIFASSTEEKLVTKDYGESVACEGGELSGFVAQPG